LYVKKGPVPAYLNWANVLYRTFFSPPSPKVPLEAGAPSPALPFMPLRNIQKILLMSVRIIFLRSRSEDVSHICYQDSCAEEVFYPLMTPYDGESREVAIAYGLILVVFVLLITGVSTPLLQNLKTLVIG
jgi:hypothetical protein